jgi:hypothetical protein
VIYEQDQTAGLPFSFRGEDLAQRKVLFRVKPGMKCHGSVRCADGPVPGAQVTLFCNDTTPTLRLTTRTDKEGRFSFAGLESGPASLVVVSEGFAPAFQSVTVSTNAVAVVLEPGRTLQAIAQDDSAHPLAHTLFQVTLWKRQPWLEYFGYSDAAGRFRWDSAPADSVTFCVFHHGFRIMRNVQLSSGTAPSVLILEPQP